MHDLHRFDRFSWASRHGSSMRRMPLTAPGGAPPWVEGWNEMTCRERLSLSAFKPGRGFGWCHGLRRRPSPQPFWTRLECVLLHLSPRHERRAACVPSWRACSRAGCSGSLVPMGRVQGRSWAWVQCTCSSHKLAMEGINQFAGAVEQWLPHAPRSPRALRGARHGLQPLHRIAWASWESSPLSAGRAGKVSIGRLGFHTGNPSLARRWTPPSMPCPRSLREPWGPSEQALVCPLWEGLTGLKYQPPNSQHTV